MIVRGEALAGYTARIFEAKGLSSAEAKLIADVLVWANLRGVDTHGVMRAQLYADFVDGGVINPAASPRRRNETAGAFVLDADRAAGPVAMMQGADGAVEKARKTGIGMALVARTTHTAALGFYARHIIAQGCACLIFSASGRHMPYHGTREAAVSTSPVCIGVPAGRRGSIVLDMAMSAISAGKVMLARKTGETLPPDTAIDEEGVVTTDGRRAILPLPLAGPKGAGLALMSELLTGLLTGDPILSEALADAKAKHRQNAMIVAIDIGQFVDLTTFRSGADAIKALLSAMPRQPGVEAILMPGQRGDAVAEQRSRDGIPVQAQVWSALVQLGQQLGVEPPEAA